MMQKPEPINNFKRGDIITRIEPSKPLPGYNEITGDELRDRGFIGAPLKFLGIANGCVNLERYEPSKINDEDDSITSFSELFKMITGSVVPIALPLDIWSDGWSKYINPYTLPDDDYDLSSMEDDTNKLVISEIESELKKALAEEKYEKADKLRKELDRLLKDK